MHMTMPVRGCTRARRARARASIAAADQIVPVVGTAKSLRPERASATSTDMARPPYAHTRSSGESATEYVKSSVPTSHSRSSSSSQ